MVDELTLRTPEVWTDVLRDLDLHHTDVQLFEISAAHLINADANSTSSMDFTRFRPHYDRNGDISSYDFNLNSRFESKNLGSLIPFVPKLIHLDLSVDNQFINEIVNKFLSSLQQQGYKPSHWKSGFYLRNANEQIRVGVTMGYNQCEIHNADFWIPEDRLNLLKERYQVVRNDENVRV